MIPPGHGNCAATAWRRLQSLVQGLAFDRPARRRSAQHRDDILDLFGDEVAHLEFGADEPLFPHMREKRQQRSPEAADIRQQHGFAMAAELNPGELLDQFLERADAARQGDEGVGALVHHALARVHVGHNDEFLRALEGEFPVPEEIRDNSCDVAAARHNLARHDAHEPVVAAAIDEAHAGGRELAAQRLRGRREARIVAAGGAAVDADIPDFMATTHGTVIARRGSGVKPREARIFTTCIWYSRPRAIKLSIMKTFNFATISTAAAVVAGVVSVGVLGWRLATAPAPTPATPTSSPAPAAPVVARQTPPPPAPVATAAQPTPSPATPTTAAPAAPGQTAAAPAMEIPRGAPPAKAQLPEFDVARVETSGDAVVAGRAAPQSQVRLYNRDTKIAEVRADANGQFVIIPPPLAPGDHVLSLGAGDGSAEVRSEQTVAVAVAAKPGEKTLAALTSPDKPTVPLGEPARPATPAGGAPVVAIRTVEAGDDGAFFASGLAPADASVRLYLNGSPIAAVQTAPDGKWAVKIERGMTPGHYDVRADMFETASGKVLARAEVPFDYPAPAPRPAAQAPAIATAPPVQVARAPIQPTPVAPPAAASNPPPRPAPPEPTSAPASPPSPPAPASAPAVAATPPVDVGAPPRPVAAAPVAAPSPPTAPAMPPVAAPVAPANIAAASPPATPTVAQPGLAVVPEIQSVTVIRGDNLWRISRRILGRGARYTQIYEANAKQIRDPNRIWPGQIFVAPQTTAQ